jgi:hypothetical protein
MEDVPIVKSKSENEDPEVCKKLLQRRLKYVLNKYNGILNRIQHCYY